MARKKRIEEHENHERWLVSYADFITLLFAFFVVMYSISSVNEGKYRVLSDSMVAAFRDPARSLEPVQVGDLIRSSEQSEEMPDRNKPSLKFLKCRSLPSLLNSMNPKLLTNLCRNWPIRLKPAWQTWLMTV